MSTTLWQLDEQTLGKHIVLRSYLDGWFPILGSWHGRLLFIDGFTGPGEYASGEAGSPLVALDCVRRHKTEGRLSGVEVVCVFIESDGKRARYLEGVVHSQPPIPKARAHVLTGTFDNHMTRILDQIEEQNKAMAPAFVMVDPFGIKGSPMALIKRVLQNPRSECLISFMYEPIRRFHSLPEFEPHLNELFGTTRWQDCLQIQDEPSRKRFLHGLFQRQLKRHGAAYVVPSSFGGAKDTSTRFTLRPAV